MVMNDPTKGDFSISKKEGGRLEIQQKMWSASSPDNELECNRMQ